MCTRLGLWLIRLPLLCQGLQRLAAVLLAFLSAYYFFYFYRRIAMILRKGVRGVRETFFFKSSVDVIRHSAPLAVILHPS